MAAHESISSRHAPRPGEPSLASPPATASVWRNGLTAAGVAAIANLGILAMARAGGVSFLVGFTDQEEPMRIGVFDVALASILPLLVAAALASLAARRSRTALRLVQVAVGVAALLSLGAPLSLMADLHAKLALAAMHVVAGAAFVLALERAGR